MEKINVKKSELVDAFSHCVRNSLVVGRYYSQWICPYRNSYGELVYCIVRLDAGAALSALPYKTLRCMANLLDDREPFVYIFTIRYSFNTEMCYLLIDKE